MANAAISEKTDGANVGVITVVDPDEVGETFSYIISDPRFEIDGGVLKLISGNELDAAIEPTLDVEVTAISDSDGSHIIAQTFTITVVDANDAPTGIDPDTADVDENADGAVVATLTTIDPDLVDNFTYTVDDARFEVVGDQLKLKAGETLDHEADETITVNVTSSDKENETVTESIVITVNDINEAPTALTAVAVAADENLDGAVVADLTLDDPEGDTNFTYTVSDARFEVVGGQLKLKAGSELDFETDDGQTVTVTATSEEFPSHTISSDVTLDVNDINEAPTALTSVAVAADENLDGAVVADLTLNDPEGDTNFTYTVSDARFEVVGGQLKLKAGSELDFETDDGQTVTVTATSDEFPSHTISSDVTLDVNDINEAPTALTAVAVAADENLDGAVVADLTLDDPEGDTNFTYTVSDARFEVVGGQLKLKAGSELDFESDDGQTVTVTATSDEFPSHTISSDVTLDVNDINEAPTALTSVAVAADENLDGAVVADLTLNDPEGDTNFTYTVSDARFEVVGGQLKLKAGSELDFESDDGQTVTVTATSDEFPSHTISSDVTLDVNDINEAPTALTAVAVAADENLDGAVVADLTLDDPEGDTNFTYTVSDARFEVVGGQLKLKAGSELDFESDDGQTVTVTATSDEFPSHTISSDVTLDVNDINEAPTALTSVAVAADENLDGAVVADLTLDDPEGDTNFTYTVSDARFEVVGGQLKLKAGSELDFETDNGQTVTVTATSDEFPSHTISSDVTLDVNDINEAPTALTSVAVAADENLDGAVVADLTLNDPEGDTNFTYTVSDARFEVVGGQLKLKAGSELDFETDNGQTVTVTATSDEFPSHTISSEVTLDVNDINEVPTDISLANAFVSENTDGANVGAITVVDPDQAGETFSYDVSDDIIGDNFEINNGILKLKPGVQLDAADGTAITVTVTATSDSDNTHTITEIFNITVVDANDAPTDITLDNTTVDEEIFGAVVANISTTDPDVVDNFTYTFSDDRFEVVNGVLKLKDGEILNHESEDSILLEVTSSDKENETVTKAFTITVNDLNEGPSSLTAVVQSVDENLEAAIIADLTLIDPEGDLDYDYSVDDPRFEVIGGQLKLKTGESLDFETDAGHVIAVTATNVTDPTHTITTDVTVDLQDLGEVYTGDSSDETIVAGAADDTLRGNGGDDTLVGGAGADTYIWAQGDGYDTIQATGDDTGADIIQIEGSGFYDLNFTWDDNHLYVGVAADTNYDPDDVGGIIKIENFRNGSDSVAYIEANLEADNTEWYTGTTTGPVRLYTTSGLNGIDQGAYTELLIGTSGNDVMSGNGGFFDYIFGQGGNDHLIGSDVTRDELRGGTGNDLLEGMTGNDRLAGEQGDDVLDGGEGTDLARYDRNSGSNGAYVNLSSSTRDGVLSNTARDTHGDTDTLISIEDIRGSDNNDTLIGSDGANNLRGKAGDDTFEGGLGNDYLRGDDGIDTAVFSGNLASYIITINGDEITVAGPDGTDTLTGIERLRFDDGLFDAITLTPLEEDQIIDGDGTANALVGGAGQDTLNGNGGDDTLTGNEGNDILVGGAGADVYVWAQGDGYDTIKADGDDTGADIIQIEGSGFYDLNFTWDDNHLYVGVAADTNYDPDDVGGIIKIENFRNGSDSVAYIEAFLEADNTEWYTGSTTGPVRLYTTSGLNGIDQGAYTELLIGTSGNDVMSGNGGFFDYIFGQGGDDHLIGSDVTRDELRGGTGNDLLEGMTGNDRLAGEQGDDVLDGGEGTDLARYDRNSGSDGAYVNLSSSERDGVASNTARDTHGDTDTLISIEDIRGSDNNDTLIGSDGDNYLRGKDGDDILEGGLGDDYLRGDGGIDTAVFAGSINDYVFRDQGNGIRVSARNGLDGSDFLQDIEFLQFDDGLFNAADLTFVVDQLIEGDGTSETLTGGDGNDIIIGNGGDDILEGGLGDDTYVHGIGDGHDTVISSNDDASLDTVSFKNGAYDLGWWRDGDDLIVYSASDDTYDSATDGTVRLTDHFVAGKDSIDFIATDLDGTENDAFYTDQSVVPGGIARVYFAKGLDGIDQGAYTEVVFGTDAAETITGGGGYRDYLYGFGGNDTITAGDGNDRLYGGFGNDQLFGGDGNDRFRGGEGVDTFNGGSGDQDEADYRRDVNDGGTAAVTVDLEAGTATDGFGDNDTLISIEQVRGTEEGDIILGSSANNRLRGHGGNDTLEGRDGDDRLEGGSGNDTLRGGEGNDELNGGSGDDNIFTGNATFDYGDTVIGSTGNDTIDFETGQGFYTLYYGDLTDPVFFNLSDSVNATIPAFTIDKGGDGTDTLVNLNAINSDDGGLGVIGTSGNDTYIGQNNANSWTQIRLGAGNDTITGGIGTERLDYSDAEKGVNVNIGTGTTSQDGFDGTDTFSGIEEIRGSDFADILIGGDGNDRFIGRDGDDVIDGGDGFDTVRYDRGSAGSIDVDLENEIGTVTGTWNGNAFTHSLSNIENIRGSNNADIIRGDAADNTFLGKSGDDILMGRAGSDELSGGSGADTFDFTGQIIGTDIDTITDYNFGEDDILDISDLITFADGGIVADFFKATGDGSGTSIAISTDGGSNYIQIAHLDGIFAGDQLRVILDSTEQELTVVS